MAYLRLMRIKIFYLFSLPRIEIFSVLIQTFYLCFAAAEIFISKPGTILKKLQKLSLSPAKRIPFLNPLKQLQTSRFVSLLEAVDRNLFGSPSCLRRSLALSYLGRALGIVSEVKIGIFRTESSLQAHSWLEYEGIRLEVENDSSIYSELLPAGAL